MTTYTKTTDFLAKDYLITGNPAKKVKGSEIDTEFNNIATADADNLKTSDLGTGVETALGVNVGSAGAFLTSTEVGVSVQSYSANLDEYAAVNPTAAGLAILDDADAAAQRTTLGLAIGVDVQAYDAVLAGIAADTTMLSFRNKIINGGFAVNQRVYVSGAAVGTGLYGHDRWKMAASGDTYTFSTTNNKTTVTIPAGKVLQQVIEGLNLQTGTYTLSWEGTAQGKIGAGALSDSGVTGSITGGTNTTIEFGPGTVANIQLEPGSVATPFEARPYGTELALCQRYYYTHNLTTYAAMYNTTDIVYSVWFKTTMRVQPTVTKTVTNGVFGAETTTVNQWQGFYTGAVVGSLSAFTASAEL